MRKHRGLSAVIGTVFLVAVVVSSLSYVTYSMNTLGNFSESLIIEEKRQKDKQSEEFEISSVDITAANKLDGVVTNTGVIPLKIKSLWIEEVGTPNSVKKFKIDKTVAPGDQINLINSINFVMNPAKGYTMKMISDRGDVQTFNINSAGTRSLYLTNRAIPAAVATEFDTTILVTVTNNSTNNAPILNLTPILTVDDTSCTPTCFATLVPPTPSSYPSLKPGETTTFVWVYTINGVDSNMITFTASLTNGVAANTATSTVQVRNIVSALESGTALSSAGLISNSITDNTLMLHKETDRTPPVTSYQMFSADTDGGSNGLKIDLDTAILPANLPNFFTENYTAGPIVIPAGNWITSLRLQSEALPFSLKNEYAQMIFHFNENKVNPENSNGTATADLEYCGDNTFTQIAQEDSEQKESDGIIKLTDNDLDMVDEGTSTNIIGLRYTGIDIPQGATILSAYIQFTAEETTATNNVSLRIYGQAIDDAPALTSNGYDLTTYGSDRINTAAFVNWNALPAWTTGDALAAEKTPDIKTVIQEIVNRGGWVRGNNIVIKIEDNGQTNDAKRVAEPMDGDVPSAAPELKIVWAPSAITPGAPTYESTSGPHATGATAGTITGITDGAYRFDGVNDCLRSKNNISASDGNKPQIKPDTTSLWFKTAATVGATTQHLVSWGGSNENTVCPDCDNYKIFLQGTTGKLYFWFNTEHASGKPTDITMCKSTNRYDNSLWYHVVAVRDSPAGSIQDDCRLYITNLDGTDAEIIFNATSNTNTDAIDANGKWVIGSNEAESGNFFNGWIDDVMHWDYKKLDATEADELSHVNYGTTAQKLNLYIDRTNKDGVNQANIVTQTVNVPFYDPKADLTDNLDSTYGVFNFTIARNEITVLPDQRLNFTISYVPSTSTWKALELDMKIDDQNITPKSSLIQIPTPSIAFPSYWVYDKYPGACCLNPTRLTASIFNVGPYGSWFVYQGTRAIFDDPATGNSYAALLCAVNSTSATPCLADAANEPYLVTENRDSIFIGVGKIAKMYFWTIKDRPDNDSTSPRQTGEIPDGTYVMSVFINGYDETGNKFVRNVELGRIKVTT